ncbi:hypothetical protein GQ54DRAFT_299130 [Martensiomyces pterosporus]|nr:hypothetical protein GQ54DRAFT_299130 [Martensiomyces pterosporus]
MAPEILHYEPYDAKADLWSIGAVIYEMLAGKPPFHASNHVELARIIERTNDNIVFPDERKAAADDDKSDSGAAAAFEAPNGIDPVLKDLVRRLLKMKPSNRMSFHEFFAHPALQPQLDSSQPPPQAQTLSGNAAAAAAASGSSSGGYDGILQLPENATASARQSLGTPEGGRHMDAGGNAAHATGSGSRPASSNSPRRDAILYHHRQQQQQQTPSTRSHSLDTGESSVLSAQQLPSRDGDNGRRRTVPDTAYHQAQVGHRDDHLSAAMGRLNMDDGQHRYQQQGQRANVYPPPSQQQYRQMQQRRSGDLDSRVSVDAAGHQRKNSLADEDQAMAEREYVVIEKRAVEMNVLADELESSPRTPIAFYPPRAGAIQQAPGVARQMTALARAVHDAVSSQYQISTEAANGPLNSRVAAAASAGLLSSDAGRRTGVSSRSVHGVFNPLDAELAETFESRHSQGSPPEEPTIRRMEGLAYKAFAMSFLADLKWRLLPPSALGGSPSSRRQRQQQQQRAGPTDPLADPDGGFLSPSDVSIEEAFVLYLKALSLLHRAMIVASRYWASMHKTAVPGGEHGGYSISTSAIAMGAGRSSSVSQSSAGTGGSSTVAVVSVAFNSAVQWVRSKFNECLERAEALKQLANGGELDNVAQVSIEQVLYEQALSLSKMAAVRELKWIDPLDCDRAYQLAIWMLSAILEATDTASSASMRMEDGSAGFEDGSSSVDREEMDLEDRTIIEQFIASIVKRRETLQRRLIQQEAAAANV